MNLDRLDHRSGLVDRHIAFLEALRGAGLSVSLAEDLDAVAALSALPWDRRSTVRDAYAATLVKRQVQRPTFETLFDVYFPALVGEGVQGAEDGTAGETGPVRDNAEALAEFREQLLEALAAGDEERLARLAVEMVGRFGAMPGRVPGCPAGRRTPLSSGSRRRTSSTGSSPHCSPRVAARRRPPGSRAGGSARSPGRSRATPAAG